MQSNSFLKLFRSSNGKKQTQSYARKNHSSRSLRLESLEERQLLSVTTAEYDQIREDYPTFQLSENQNDINTIELTSFTTQDLQNAIQQAAQTEQNDLIVLKFDVDHSSINLNESIKINFDLETSGNLTIVSYGASLFQISSKENEIFSIQSGAVNLGGFSFIGGADGTESNLNLISTGEEVSLTTERVVYFKGNFGEINAIAKKGITDENSMVKTTDSEEILSLSAEFNTEGTEWAYVTGLSLEEATGIATAVYSYSVSDYFDVNKNWVDDSGLCWAATASNMLKYAGYGGNNSVQEIFDEFKYCFSNDGGDAYYGCRWYLSGDYGTTNGPTIEHEGGGHHPTVSVLSTVKQYWSTYLVPSSSYSLSSIASFLKNGEGAVGVGILWEQGGGHNVTMWGYYYDTQYASTSPYYYTKLVISCSDDDLTRKYASPIAYASDYDTYCFTDYSADGTNVFGIISDFVTLKKNTSTPSTLPDLIPWKNSGWDAPVVVSTSSMSTTNSTLSPTDTIYIRGAYCDNLDIGDISTFTVKYTLSGSNITTKTRTTTVSTLTAGKYVSNEWEIGTLAAGTYTVKMEVDYGNVIPETNENNNSYSCTFTVEGQPTKTINVSIPATATSTTVNLTNNGFATNTTYCFDGSNKPSWVSGFILKLGSNTLSFGGAMTTSWSQTPATLTMNNTENTSTASRSWTMPVKLSSSTGTVFANIVFTQAGQESTPDPVKLSTPTISSSSSTENSITINWSKITNASSYVVEYKLSSASSYTQRTVSKTATSYTITGLSESSTYNVRMYAVGDGTNYTNSDRSAVKTITTSSVSTSFDLSTSNGGTLSVTSVTQGNSFNLSNVSIKNNGTAASGSYTIKYYASTNSTINTSDTLLGTYTMSSLGAGSSTTDSRTFSTSSLTAGTSYYIGWIITGTGDSDTSNNTGRTTSMLTVNGNTNKVQSVYSDQANRSVLAGSSISLPIMYKALDSETNLTGLGLRIHYNSSYLTYTGNTDLFRTGALSTVQDNADTNNNDNDSSTDRVLIMAWSDTLGEWPGAVEQLLMKLNFTVNSSAEMGSSTTIRFTASSTTAGYIFQGTPINLQIVSGNLDIDGDGTVSMLTDSLLLKRYLSDFSGTSLINRAIGTGAVNTTSEQVSAYIQSVYDIFDIDGNGTVDMLTDGLLLDRYLSDFQGDALIARAVGNSATRTMANAISSYIESLIPAQGSNAFASSLSSDGFNQSASIISTTKFSNDANHSLKNSSSTQVQSVYFDLTDKTITAGSNITLPVMYKALDGEANLTGLGLRIHYNSNYLTYTGNTNLFRTGALSVVQDNEDTNNNDNDSSTDRVLIMAWSDTFGEWPGSVEQLLVNLNFTVNSSVAMGSSTTIRSTASSTTAGYTFQGTPVTLNVEGTPATTSPDLSTSNGGTLSATSVTQGDSFKLSNVSIKNNGTTASGSYTIKYYASTNSTINTSDTLLGTYTMSSLGAGSSTTDSRTFSTTSLTAGTSYYIGWIITGTGDSDTSNNTGRTTGMLTVTASDTPDPVKLSTPSISSSSSTKDSITINWSKIANASSYVVEYKLSSATSYTQRTVSSTATSYTITGLSESSTYNVRMYAVGDKTNYSNSDRSAVKTITTQSDTPEPVKLSTPSISSSSSTKDSITINWSKIANASGYVVEYKLSSASTYTQRSVSSTATSYTITGLSESSTYNVRMYAVGDGTNYTNSDRSTVKTITTQSTTPEPSSLTVNSVRDVINASDGVTTLREAIANAVAGDTITFDDSLAGKTITLSGKALTITKGITIDANSLGDDGIIISGANKSSIFNVTGGSVDVPVTLSNLTLTSGKTKWYGGILANSGVLVVQYSSFVNGNAYYGGAISNNGTLVVGACYFADNTSTFGGAVYNRTNGRMAVISSCAEDNSAANQGGFLFSNGIIVQVEDSEIYNNTANNRGGAFYFAKGSNLVSGSYAAGNSARNYGGFAYNMAETVITYSSIEGSSSLYGGAVVNTGTFTLNENSSITGCSSIYGGAVYNRTSGILNVLEESILGYNTASRDGGAIYNYGTVEIDDGYFYNNASSNRAGVIYNVTGSITISNSLFEDNETAYYGGSIYNAASLDISDTDFIGNTATYGGAIANVKTMSLTNNNFVENFVSKYGGAIYSSSSVSTTITGGLFDVNSANQGGGIYVRIGTVKLNSVVLLSNSATHSGGAIYNGNQTILTDCYLYENQAKYYGGAINNQKILRLNGSNYFGDNETDTGKTPDIYTKSGGSVIGTPIYESVTPQLFDSIFEDDEEDWI